MKMKLLSFVTIVAILGFSATSFTYTPISKDNDLVNKLTQRIEQVISEKGEKTREPLVKGIQELVIKYINYPRFYTILNQVMLNIEGKTKNNTIINENLNNSFIYDEKRGIYHGKIVLTGYISIIEIEHGFCEESCTKFPYVFFNINNINNKFFNNFLIEYKGNSFVRGNSISLGCTKNDIITFFNTSDEFGLKEYILSSEESKIILNSTNKYPVKIEVEKLPLLYGGSAPNCYSHFSGIKVFGY